MKKGIRVLALIMIACLALCVFAACDTGGGEKPSEEPSHTHSYSDEWSSDDTNHWHECKCGEKSGLAGHNWDEGVVTDEPTEEEEGEKLFTCSDCGKTRTETIPVLEHTHNHSTEWSSDGTNHWHECACGDKDNEEEHTPGAEATETTDQKCIVCDRVIVPALGHVHANHLTLIEKKDSTCTKTGNIEYYECSCGKWYTDETATQEITDKTTVIVSTIPHSCTELKYNSANHWYECECGLIDGETAHYGGTATCTAKAKCTVCSQEYGELKTHDYATTYTSDDTNHWRKCNDCTATTDNGEHTYSNGVCVCGKTEEVEAAYTVVDEDTILFGSYPQSEVTDTTLISTLSASAGTLPTSSNSASWTSYGYYISGSVQNYMWYIDLDYSGERYRGVYFTQYRPYYTTSASSSSNTYQDDNGYSTGTVYWFKYESISWTILDKDKGLILCDMIIDSQAYQNEYEYKGSTGKYYIKGTRIYANNYEYSTIRAWLNDTFYNTAFNALQQGIIKTTQVDNSVASTGYTSNPYVCNDTNDKVFLLSASEVMNTSYGFSSDYSAYDTARRKKTTAYAQSQGAGTSTSSTYLGNGYWWLRSPYNNGHNARFVSSSGDLYSNPDNFTWLGVVPALQIQLNEEEHTHSYDTLNYDSVNHWYECECGEIDGELTTHDYAITYTSDDTSHWRKCNDCTATIDNGTHTYENGVCVCGKTEEIEAAYTVVDEDTILFGSYPQSEVTDTTLISTLSASAGTLPTSSNSASWTSYGYYISNSVQNYMWYIDLDYSGERYRGVYFTSYRPSLTTNSSSSDNSCQDDNGYTTGTVYWFKYEPISWTILDKDEGLILCDMIIDSQAYQNEYEYSSSDSEYYIKGTNIYANNYEYSTIRAWLNDTFYNTAFNTLQKGIIKTRQVVNDIESTGYSDTKTKDKVFLLSASEVMNTSYGFSSDYNAADTTRRKKTTAYAQSQGAYTSSSFCLGNGYWWVLLLSGFDSDSARFVSNNGCANWFSCVTYTDNGVVPALQIQL